MLGATWTSNPGPLNQGSRTPWILGNRPKDSAAAQGTKFIGLAVKSPGYLCPQSSAEDCGALRRRGGVPWAPGGRPQDSWAPQSDAEIAAGVEPGSREFLGPGTTGPRLLGRQVRARDSRAMEPDAPQQPHPRHGIEAEKTGAQEEHWQRESLIGPSSTLQVVAAPSPQRLRGPPMQR